MTIYNRNYKKNYFKINVVQQLTLNEIIKSMLLIIYLLSLLLFCIGSTSCLTIVRSFIRSVFSPSIRTCSTCSRFKSTSHQGSNALHGSYPAGGLLANHHKLFLRVGVVTATEVRCLLWTEDSVDLMRLQICNFLVLSFVFCHPLLIFHSLVLVHLNILRLSLI